MTRHKQQVLFSVLFGFVCASMCLLLMLGNSASLGRVLGDIHIIPFYIWLFLLRIPHFGFWGSILLYSSLVFAQWCAIGWILTFIFLRLKK